MSAARLVAARIRRRYGSIKIADGGKGSNESAGEELRYYQYTMLAQQDQPEKSRGKKRTRSEQADDEFGSAYLFHVVPVAGTGT